MLQIQTAARLRRAVAIERAVADFQLLSSAVDRAAIPMGGIAAEGTRCDDIESPVGKKPATSASRIVADDAAMDRQLLGLTINAAALTLGCIATDKALADTDNVLRASYRAALVWDELLRRLLLMRLSVDPLMSIAPPPSLARF